MSKTKESKKESKESVRKVLSHAFSRVGMWDAKSSKVGAGQPPQAPYNFR